jgi:RNA polymerase sigma-70 factor (ECF subfamily)
MIFAFLSSLTVPDDERLMARVADGDDRALKALYDRYAGRVLAAARRLLDNQAEAEEVVQETFLDVWNRASSFDRERGTTTSWVMTIGRNRAIDHLRRRVARGRMDQWFRQADSPEPVAQPEQQLATAQDRRRVVAALDVLSPDQRIVVELAYFDGLSQSEIAERTGEPIGTIKGRARSALERLAAHLSKGVA